MSDRGDENLEAIQASLARSGSELTHAHAEIDGMLSELRQLKEASSTSSGVSSSASSSMAASSVHPIPAQPTA
jgi:hypothetical protein